MTSFKDLCCLLLTTDLSNRHVGERINASHNTVKRYRGLLADKSLSWLHVQGMSEDELDLQLNGSSGRQRKQLVNPDFSYVHAELHKVGVTLSLLYDEYAESLESGVMSQREFYRRYKKYRRSLGIVMRQIYRPGEKLFIDFSGKRPCLCNRQTGEFTYVELFVTSMAASRKIFAYAVPSQQLRHWIDAHVQAFKFYGGMPHQLVPDNLKSAVVSITRLDGHVINPTYADMADHYDTVVLPTRACKPKDKALVEVSVKLAQRYILGPLRNHIFYSIEELNEAIRVLIDQFNDKPMRGHGNKTRNQLFAALDQPALKPLPVDAYEFAEWKLNVTVQRDYHIQWVDHYYSVPHSLVGAKVNIKVTVRSIEIFHRETRVPAACHVRNDTPGCSTKLEHRPPAHQFDLEEQLSMLLTWAQSAGISIHQFIHAHMELRRHPLGSRQVAHSLKKLSLEFTTDRVNAACERALRIKSLTATAVKRMLKLGLERAPLRDTTTTSQPIASHDNVRGAASYSE